MIPQKKQIVNKFLYAIMGKKILLLTTIYPAPDLKYGTPSIHYFTREWVKMGCEVKVIHYQAVYLSIFYLFAKLFRERIASKTGAVVFTKKEKEDKHYEMDGVSIYRFPIFKKIPHGRYSSKVISEQVNKIKEVNESEGFSPDIIIGHFSNPQLEIIPQLKNIYSSRTCLIMHDVGNSIKSTFKNEYENLMSYIDIWGYRSMPIKNGFENNFGEKENSFMCYSGIPEKYISLNNNRNFTNKIRNFIYVGELIKRKHPSTLIHAINKVYQDKDYEVVYVGSGAEESVIKSQIKKLSVEDCVSFKGKIPREDILTHLDNSECMIMISSNEAFGLVYLEAMGRGCITIGSRNEGIDGIIENGVNGFLCEAGNYNELAEIIKHINSLSPEERVRISRNANLTVKEMTEYLVAEKYINKIFAT